MELKDFVKGTISSVVAAIEELQQELSEKGSDAKVAPEVGPFRGSVENVGQAYPAGVVSGTHPPQSVTEMRFDIALTVGKEGRIEAVGGVSGDVFFAKGRAEGTAAHSGRDENVSRVQFVVAVALPRPGKQGR